MDQLLNAGLAFDHKGEAQRYQDGIRDSSAGLLPKVGSCQLAFFFLPFADGA